MKEIKNLKKLASRLKEAVSKNEKIVLFSDSDLDGVASAIILEESLKTLGHNSIFLYFPDREEEGYGFSDLALNYLKKFAPSILVLMDCGIGNFAQVKKAREIGFEVLIVEHHEILDRLPEADLIVNPKQPGDNFPFKFLATCGLSFLIAKELLGKNFSPSLERSFLELVAVATIADKMPQEDINKELIEKGLRSLSQSARPGLRIFFQKYPDALDREIVERIISTLQITKNHNHLPKSYLLLSACSMLRAQELLKEISSENFQRRESLKNFFEKFVREIDLSSPFIFKGDEALPLSITGGLALRLSEKFEKPAFVFSIKKNIVRGSVRTVSNLNTVQALKFCRQYLLTYGGHPPASGFSLKKANLENFKKCLNEYFSRE